MSATLDIETFQKFFGSDQVITFQIPGRQYPVQLVYTEKPVNDYMEATLYTIVQIHEHEDPGDILVVFFCQARGN